jgi:hypothetical protein
MPPPDAPLRSKSAFVTPAGIVMVWSAPVYGQFTVTTAEVLGEVVGHSLVAVMAPALPALPANAVRANAVVTARRPIAGARGVLCRNLGPAVPLIVASV